MKLREDGVDCLDSLGAHLMGESLIRMGMPKVENQDIKIEQLGELISDYETS